MPHSPIRSVFFDAAGTLIHLAEPVGHGYARVASSFGISLDPTTTTEAFRAAWTDAQPPDYKSGPAPDGDRSWWRPLVDSVLDRCLGKSLPPPHTRLQLFEALYAHYALPESWRLFPEVPSVLARLASRGIPLLVVSNFDPRLRLILGGLHVAHHFHSIVISSEIGSYKPDPAIFLHAAAAADLPPTSCLHVGDDPVADLAGARSAGLQSLLISRPQTSLDAIFNLPHFPT